MTIKWLLFESWGHRVHRSCAMITSRSLSLSLSFSPFSRNNQPKYPTEPRITKQFLHVYAVIFCRCCCCCFCFTGFRDVKLSLQLELQRIGSLFSVVCCVCRAIEISFLSRARKMLSFTVASTTRCKVSLHADRLWEMQHLWSIHSLCNGHDCNKCLCVMNHIANEAGTQRKKKYQKINPNYTIEWCTQWH